MLHPLLSTSAVSETLASYDRQLTVALHGAAASSLRLIRNSDHNFLIRVPPEELADQLTLDEARLFRSVWPHLRHTRCTGDSDSFPGKFA